MRGKVESVRGERVRDEGRGMSGEWSGVRGGRAEGRTVERGSTWVKGGRGWWGIGLRDEK